MAKENKYYTPEIEEFHVGFEYEQEDINEGGSSLSWYKHTILEGSDINQLYKAEEQGLGYRVKYLDKEDIESLGFRQIERTVNSFESNDDNYLSLEYFKENKGWYLTYSENESQFGFGGWIKNKSELKKLLKQLNIITHILQ